MFLGLFFTFGVVFGVDPSDVSGVIAAQLIHGFFAQVDPLVCIAGIVLSIATFLAFVKIVWTKWDKDRVDGFAAFYGFLAGGLTLIDPLVSIVFWIGGVIALTFWIIVSF
ncbi:MAG TPA: hypothetical protein VGR56_06075 [Nitrososphaerales archaeon]|nr:hypothetical protein [Nitrososphaerales archaeon]